MLFRSHTIMLFYNDGMVRTQIQFTEEQIESLRVLSRTQGRSVSDIVRSGVDGILRDSDREQKRKRFFSGVGKYRSGIGDIAENHDRYLAEDFA